MATEQAAPEAGVRAASDRFYEALEQMANGDASAMADAWSHADDVTTMHPIGGREVGWDEVREPWGSIADISTDGTISRSDQVLRVFGDIAYELATENVSMTLADTPVEGEYRATNVYRLEDGEWKMVHHHSDLSEPFVEILEGLNAGA
jgi:ketosteroid isomerase-like protein